MAQGTEYVQNVFCSRHVLYGIMAETSATFATSGNWELSIF